MTSKSARWGRTLAAAVAASVLLTGGVLTAPPTAATAATLSPAERYAPTVVPDRITLTPSADPTTGQVIAWRTSTEVAQPVVEYRTLTPAPYPSGVRQQLAQSTVEQATDLGYSQAVHTAELSGLAPNTAYMYRVGDGTNFSEWQDFETSAVEAENFSFIFLGDIQTDILDQGSRVVRNAFRDRPNADIVLQIGDLVNDAHSDQQWGELYEAFSYTLGTQRLLTTPGNHEYDGGLSEQYRAQFTYPANGPTGEGEVYDELEGTVYYTDHQGVRFISLNSNVVDTEGLAVQTEWLEGVLAENPHQWTVVFFHHPVFSLDEGRNNLGIRTSWGPLLEEYDVDLVLAGHDHAYGRGNTYAAEENLPEGADAELSHTGPVYIGSTASSKMYEVGPRLWEENGAHLRRLETGKQFYQLIDVTSGTLRYESRTADGEFFDGFTITKSEAGKLVTDGVDPQVIEPNGPGPCLGCEEPGGPGEEIDLDAGSGTGELAYAHEARLTAVNRSNAALPAGVAYHQTRDVLYLGDQNGRTIFELDTEGDTILRTITMPENIRDIGLDEEGELLYVGQQNRNWSVVSIADENFGEVVRGPYPIIESNRSIDVDPVHDFAYVAVPSRGVEVFRASTGESLGVIRDTADAYYVAADPVTGLVVSTNFHDVAGVVNIHAFDATDGFARVWAKATRSNPRQVDIDSSNGMLYVGYTGTSATTGGFSVHEVDTGMLIGDFPGSQYGKDGYGITIDEQDERVFVANRDFRLNPPGEELDQVAVTVSKRVDPGTGEGPGEGPGEGEDPGGDPEDPPTGLGYTPTALTAIPAAPTELSPDIRPVGSVVDSRTGYLYVADEMRPARVHVIDPASDTAVAVLSAPTTDPVEDGLRDIALDESRNELYVAFGSNWVVMDATSGALVRGPYAFSGGVRGMDVDFEGRRVFGALRGTGFDVADADTGALVQTVTTDAVAWRSHGVAYDPVNDLIYVSNSDTAGSTEGIRVFSGADYSLLSSLAVEAADFRSIAVDPVAQRVYVGHQSDIYDDSGISVYAAADLSLIQRLSAYAYGNKVYGVSVDSARGVVYVSARERYPSGIIAVARDRE
ncbi:metallophosphoesterase [Salinibacterium sp. SYSU T00001]|uniref:metallophosphoesterase n=1 Tax=Homoserinimonas sedimenticola TaxID=2986805 RepID=UPI002236AF88|nr:metallophosphoesterase [Salinibacterium sedimenticola]MCW4385611.1 metallophosphoesterase [Salinibacterium sedimenticola]